ncbi:hypothetical protein BDW75DRAFT_221836 [Aspergillus navahoensis]
MRRFLKASAQGRDKYGVRNRKRRVKTVFLDDWTRKKLEKIKKCFKRLNSSGAVAQKDIQKLQRDISNIYGSPVPNSSKTEKRRQIYTAFLKSCIQKIGPYIGVLVSIALACREIADVGQEKRDALLAVLKTENLKTNFLVNLASTYFVPGGPAENWHVEYAPSAEITHAILDKMKEEKAIKLKCSIPVENAGERPLLTFAIDRELFWKVVDIANIGDVIACSANQAPQPTLSHDIVQSMSWLEGS